MELCGPHVAISPVMLRPSDIELHTAVKRLSSDLQPAGGFRPEEALEVETALSLFTHGGAYAEFAEKEKGLLCEGGLADFVVFDEDPSTCDDLLALTVQETLHQEALQGSLL